jgi:pSer/pThr/pTyr-binding forkhead associated (FHA) protein
MARLTIENGTQKGRQVAIEAGQEIKIGRASDNGIPLDDTKASRYHARVVAQGDAFLLEDLESTNGTRVNDRPVSRRILESGDVIQIGKSRLVFQGAGAEAIPTVAPTALPAGPKVDLDTPPPKAPPKFDLPPTKTVKVKLEPGRGRLRKNGPDAAPAKRERPRRRRKK